MADTKNDTSFLDEKKTQKIHIKDILFTLLRNAHWLILCGIVGAVIAGYHVRHQDRVYASNARLLIKGSSTNSESGIREASIKNMFSTRTLYNSSINNEMMILTSKSALTEVSRNLKLNIIYTAKTRLVKRAKDLYGESPITIDFIDNGEEDYVAFTATIKNDKQFELTLPDYEPIAAPYEDTVATPFGRIVAHKTWFFTPDYYGVPITVTHTSISAISEHYRAALAVARDDDFNTIVNIGLRDASPIRAQEVINEVIKVYNEDAIKEKERIIAETYDYINQRLSMLHSDLGTQENALANFKRENQLLDISSYGQSYLQSSIQSSEEIERLKKQLSQARYLTQFNQSDEAVHIIPPTIGLDDANIMALITKHNNLVLELEKYQSPNNPVVKSKMEEIHTLRSNMNRLLDGYIGLLQERIAETQIEASNASSKMSQVPQQ